MEHSFLGKKLLGVKVSLSCYVINHLENCTGSVLWSFVQGYQWVCTNIHN